MPPSSLDYDKHGRIARVKPRSKDQDSRNASSSGSGKRHRDSSVSSNWTSLPSEVPLQRSESTSSSVNLDQLPGLPDSEAGSPSSTSSPMLRTHSNVPTPATGAFPMIHRTPAFLQAFLEPDSDYQFPSEDSQATPKAEKSQKQCEPKHEPPKPGPGKPEALKEDLTLSDRRPTPVAKSSSEMARAVSVRSRSVAGPTPPLVQETPSREPHHPRAKDPIASSVKYDDAPPTSAPAYPPPNGLIGPQPFHLSPPGYPPMPRLESTQSNSQALVPQAMLYYQDYGPPPPAPHLPIQLHTGPTPKDSTNSEYRMELLHRVDSAIPDIHRLLDSYHDMHKALEMKEHENRNLKANQAVEKQEEQKRLAKFEQEVESMVKQHLTEVNQLKVEITTVDKDRKDLESRLKKEEVHNDDLEDTNSKLRMERKQAEIKHDEEKVALLHRSSLEKDRMAAEHRAKQRASHDELQAQIRKAEASLSHREAQLSRAHEESKQRLEMGWAKQTHEIQEQHANSLRELEGTHEAKVKASDEQRRIYLQARETWDQERETMMRNWQEERTLLRKGAEEQQKALTARYEREKNDILKQVSQMQHRSENEDLILRLQREIEALRTGWEADKFRFQRTTAEFSASAKMLNEHNDRLQRLTESFGDQKSK